MSQKFKATILEASGPRSFTQDSGEEVRYNNVVARLHDTDREAKFTVKEGYDLTEMLNKDVVLETELDTRYGKAPRIIVVAATPIEKK